MSIKNITKNEYTLLDAIATIELTPRTPEQCRAVTLDIDLWSIKISLPHYKVGPLFVKLRDKELVGTIPKDPNKDEHAYCYVTEKGFRSWSAIRKILKEKNRPKTVSTQKELDTLYGKGSDIASETGSLLKRQPPCTIMKNDQLRTAITKIAKKIWGKNYLEGFKSLLKKKNLSAHKVDDLKEALEHMKNILWLKENSKGVKTARFETKPKEKKNSVLDRLKKL